MNDADHTDLVLVPFAGAEPPAPDWFTQAMARTPEQASVASDATDIEYLAWGDKGKPGLLLLHGGGAHAWWWAHIAPFFENTHRVAAMSMAGMGGSGWKQSYSVEQTARDMRAMTEAAGLFEAGKPVIAGHSFGGAPTVTAAADAEGWARLAIVIDSSLDMAHQPTREKFTTQRERRYFDSLEAGLKRFRFMPPQSCENHFIADMIARKSLVEIDGKGWSWCFDPNNYRKTQGVDSRAKAKAAQCPLAIVYGERSLLMEHHYVDKLREDLPSETPFIAIPDSGHHVMVDQPLALVAAMRTLMA
ncbi:MAG: alpha/beta hydrolase [Sphingomonadaceae bacterium]|nr:alpha/beta hydrolase [Sphingomonadaceae bacterium]